jgi:hypothetical protein
VDRVEDGDDEYSKHFSRKVDAQRWLDETTASIVTGTFHIALINDEFGSERLAEVRPSQVKAWTGKMKAEGKATSYVYDIYRRFAQIMGDAVHDGIIARSPCSRRHRQGRLAAAVRRHHRSGMGPARPNARACAASDPLGRIRRPTTAEACALRVSDVDFMRGVVSPAIQWPAEPLKSECSRTRCPSRRSWRLSYRLR